MLNKLILRAGLAGSLTAMAMGASAQEDPAAKAASDAAGSAKAPAGGAIAEVMITAQRRSESIQKSSLALEVFSGEALQDAGVMQARDLSKLVPGIQIGQGGPATQIYIRGVGDFSSTAVTNPAVAVNVDGVYVARAQAVEGLFYDVERIEVLKGPQGTLYGRNATAGAVNVITNKPSLTSKSGDFSVELGNYHLVKTELAGNLPVNEVLALRAAMQVVSRRGYASEGLDDDRHRSARLQALFKPSRDLSVLLSADYTHVGGNGPAYVYKAIDPGLAAAIGARGVALPGDPRISGANPAMQPVYAALGAQLGFCIPNGALAAAATSAGNRPITGVPQGMCPPGFSSLISPPGNAIFGDRAYVNNTFKNASAELNWNLGFATLTALPAYRKVENNYVTYPLITVNDSVDKPELSVSKSLEVRLSQTTDALKWVAGLYRFDEHQEAHAGANAGVLIGRSENDFSIDTESTAAFGQLTYSLSDRLRLIGGLRMTSDTKILDGRTQNSYPGLQYLPGAACYGKASPCLIASYQGTKTFRNTAYKAGAEYDLARNHMLFFTVATGFKSGGFNTVSSSGPDAVAPFFGPEKLTAFEFGSRNRLLGDRLRLNIEAFYWKYKDAQEFYSTPRITALANAGNATLHGVDIDLTYKPAPADTLHLGMQMLHSRFDTFTYQSTGAIQGVTTGCVVTPDAVAPRLDCAGQPLPRAPNYSGAASAKHRFDLDNGGTLEASINAQFVGKRFLTIDYTEATKADSYVVGDLLLSYSPPDSNWTVNGFVRNFNDAKAYTGGYTVPSLFRGLTMGNIAAPRTFGVSASAHF